MNNLIDYWPFDLVQSGKIRRFEYDGGGNGEEADLWFYDKDLNALICREHLNDVWQCEWRLQYIPNKGIVEIADTYPQSGLMARLFGHIRSVEYSEPIGWGRDIVLGGEYMNRPCKSLSKSWPPAFGCGVQLVAFDKVIPSFGTHQGVIYSDVLIFDYLQTWNGKTTGARYWAAKGVGFVAHQWLALVDGKLVAAPRQDALVTEMPG